ncbi:MAG: glutamate--tRNA ligase [Methanomassiliicoccales archaeon]
MPAYMDSNAIRGIVRKYALQNAVFFNGKADVKAVIGKVLAEQPELKKNAKEIAAIVTTEIQKINELSLEEQRRELESIDPTLLEKKVRGEREHLLPDLPGAKEGKVVMRFAPGPSGPLHIGHTRVAILNDEYVKRYNGTFINRIEDTNPEKIDPEAYDMIREDLDWLGVRVHQTVIQSSRMELYYDIARQLIDMGKAYVCTCPVESWRKLKENGKPCPHRELPKEIQHEEFDRMLSGFYPEEKAILVVKTDLDHPNPAIRDFVGLRIVDSVPHPLTGTRYRVYPMMNFSVAIDDHFLGMTHVFRGKDHLNNTQRQEYIFRYFGWKLPWYHHYGLVSVPDLLLKTSYIAKGIKKGEYSGWDDVRLGTVRALKRRGISPESIRQYWLECGIKDVDIHFSWETLYSLNKQFVDPLANRYFFVWDPVLVSICGVDELESHAPFHPDHPDRGIRHMMLKGSPIRIYLTKTDLESIKWKGRLRLKDLCNVHLNETVAQYTGNDLSILKEGVKIVHWVPEYGKRATILMPDGSKKEGYAEPILPQDVGRVVQFERFGFVKIESIDPEITAVFTHT